MGSQNMGIIVSDLAPAQDQTIMLNNIDILSMEHCKQIQWHLNETTTGLIEKKNQILSARCWPFYLGLNALSSERVESNVRQIWEFDVCDIHEALLLTWFNSTPSMDNQSAASEVLDEITIHSQN